MEQKCMGSSNMQMYPLRLQEAWKLEKQFSEVFQILSRLEQL